jgi:uncharacterized protein YecT (DUF1311 family)
MRATLALVAALTLGIAPLQAQSNDSPTAQAIRRNAPKGVSEAFFSCVSKAGSDQDKISDCISTEKQSQDARLNKAYGALMTHLDDKSKASVRLAERAWLEFNDKSVKAETDVGATSQTNNLDVEQAEMFRYCQQANVLEHYLFATGH